MGRSLAIFISILLISNLFSLALSKEGGKGKKQKNNLEKTFKVKQKDFNKIEKKPGLVETALSEELIPVNVKNDFNEEIKVKLDTNREYPVGPNEWITLGKRKPGRYTLTIYNKKGEFVDNLTKNIDNKNKFVLNDKTVSNSSKITGLSTGQKVAITAGAIGAAALGGALINKALQGDQEQAQEEYIPPQEPIQQVVQNIAPAGVVAVEKIENAFADGGKQLKFLNKLYDEITLEVQGTDGNPIGNNWLISKASGFSQPKPLLYEGSPITINPNQKIKTILPDGTELTRNAFELKSDPIDKSYVWVLE